MSPSAANLRKMSPRRDRTQARLFARFVFTARDAREGPEQIATSLQDVCSTEGGWTCPMHTLFPNMRHQLVRRWSGLPMATPVRISSLGITTRSSDAVLTRMIDRKGWTARNGNHMRLPEAILLLSLTSGAKP